jgi:hypothetical protein
MDPLVNEAVGVSFRSMDTARSVYHFEDGQLILTVNCCESFKWPFHA